MAGRAFAFADPEIIRLAQTAFVPVSADDWYQRRRKDAEGEKRFAPYLKLYLGENPLNDASKGEQIEELKKLGVKDVQLTVYPEAQHNSWTETYNNPKVYEWLLQQRRN